jgi:hypothetical protein
VNPAIPKVDLIVLTRHGTALHPDVERGLHNQRGIQAIMHRVVGQPELTDCCRYETIARARNEGKQCGNAPWVMYVDDDVVLDSQCVRTLVDEIGRRPAFAALAADYLGEHREGQVAGHVAMGATLFRRQSLEQIRFTWAHDKCECRCCCDDLRRRHWGIDYCQAAVARHLPSYRASAATCSRLSQSTGAGHVLAAFNRRHRVHFHKQFLHSLRASGNEEPVIALAVGLYPSEQRKLHRLPGLIALARPNEGQFVGRQRLQAFEEILSRMPHDAAVAYWDVGDVVFQSRLEPLWRLVHSHPDKVLAVREPVGHPKNRAVAVWTEGIRDRSSRRRVQQLLFNNPFLNSGFLAGTVQSLLKYFRTVAHWYDAHTLAGSADPGDQIALNLYCHSNPDTWREISQSWNYCIEHRHLRAVYRDRHEGYVDASGLPIYVVHGNAQTLRSVPYRRKPHERASFERPWR